MWNVHRRLIRRNYGNSRLQSSVGIDENIRIFSGILEFNPFLFFIQELWYCTGINFFLLDHSYINFFGWCNLVMTLAYSLLYCIWSIFLCWIELMQINIIRIIFFRKQDSYISSYAYNKIHVQTNSEELYFSMQFTVLGHRWTSANKITEAVSRIQKDMESIGGNFHLYLFCRTKLKANCYGV